MANTAFAVPQTTIGLALESTRGTPAAGPYLWIPVKEPKYKPDLTLIPDDTLQGSMVERYNFERGLRYDSHGWDSYPYLDNFPLFLAAEFGSSDNKTTASSATTLYAPAAAGASSIQTNGAVANGQWIVIDTGNSLESKKVIALTTTTSPYGLTLSTPLVYSHLASATVTPLTQHTYSLLNNSGQGNQPPSCTILDYDGEEWRQLAAAQLDELTMKGNATGFTDYTCTWFANASITPSTPSPSFTAIQPPVGWTAQIAIDNSYVNYYVDWEFDFKRSVKPIPAIQGTEAYYLYFASVLTTSGKLTVVEEPNAPELTQYLAGAQVPFDFAIFDDRTGYVLDIHSSKAEFTTGELVRTGMDWVEATLDFSLLPTTTDALAGGVSPLTITVANATSAAYTGS